METFNAWLDNGILLIARALDYIINPAIVLLAVYCLIRFVIFSGIFSSMFHKIDKAMADTYDDTKTKLEDRTIIAPAQKLPELFVMKRFEDEFDKQAPKYLTVQQLVPILPLLGILGTVDGLILNMQVNGDSSQMGEALMLALTSTFLGLIGAILLKFIDAILVLPKVQKIEGDFDQYESLYNSLSLEKTKDFAEASDRTVQAIRGKYVAKSGNQQTVLPKRTVSDDQQKTRRGISK